MVAIQVRDVPEEIRDTLAAQAEAEGLSLQRYLLRLMAEQARRSRNVAWMHRFEGRDDGSRSAPGQTAAELADEPAR
ncbi:MAG: hypothetical protein L0I76_14475 [Pseudonocardia sp.]|nr:hypothetical protein [Pseudonocardia sp.]